MFEFLNNIINPDDVNNQHHTSSHSHAPSSSRISTDDQTYLTRIFSKSQKVLLVTDEVNFSNFSLHHPFSGHLARPPKSAPPIVHIEMFMRLLQLIKHQRSHIMAGSWAAISAPVFDSNAEQLLLPQRVEISLRVESFNTYVFREWLNVETILKEICDIKFIIVGSSPSVTRTEHERATDNFTNCFRSLRAVSALLFLDCDLSFNSLITENLVESLAVLEVYQHHRLSVENFFLFPLRRLVTLLINHSSFENFPLFISKLPINVNYLILQDNRLSSQQIKRYLPEDRSVLINLPPYLRSLSFDNNPIGFAAKRFNFKVLHNLTDLSLLNCNIKFVSKIAWPPNLMNLNLGGNNIQELSSNFLHCSKLQVLAIGGNAISEIDSASVLPNNLRKLECFENRCPIHLKISSSCQLEAISLSSFSPSGVNHTNSKLTIKYPLPNLIALHLDFVKFDSLSFVLKNSPSLTALILNSCLVSMSALSHLSNLSHLNTLVLTEGTISVRKFHSNSFPILTKTELKVLDLSNNDIQVLEALNVPTRIEHILLDGNDIKGVVKIRGKNGGRLVCLKKISKNRHVNALVSA